MSEVLRSPSDLPSYESSFTYPTSEETATAPSAVSGSVAELQEATKGQQIAHNTSMAAPQRVQPLLPYSQHMPGHSPTAPMESLPTSTSISGPIVPLGQLAIVPYIPSVAEALASNAPSYTAALTQLSSTGMAETMSVLCNSEPQVVSEYAELLSKAGTLLHEGQLEEPYGLALENRFIALTESLPHYLALEHPAASQLYVIAERCFDILIKLSMNDSKPSLSSHTIKFLTSIMINLNYWEIYNLIRWKPAISLFLALIKFDMNDCYKNFIKNYSNFKHRQVQYPSAMVEKFSILRAKRRRERDRRFSEASMYDGEDDRESHEDHDKADQKAKEKKKKVDAKLSAHRVIKKPELKSASARSSNYDPDVIHECQLPSAEEPGKLCLRRFSRKYELIRHQDTVHLKKKKLFKCFVCVKQDPVMGPRIFTRHDTLAKHIRVNHRISGKEAKAEVAYSKKHAEIVDEGDITVHVGRRKTKVDFELRAHMSKRGAREAPDGSIIFDDEDMLSGEEGEPMIDVV